MLLLLVLLLGLLGGLAVLLMLYRRERRRFRALITSAVDGVAIVDGQGLVQFVNRVAPVLLQRSRKQLQGQLFIAPSACGAISEISVEAATGKKIVLEIRKGPIIWRGKECWLLQFRDITRRKQLEARLVAEREQIQQARAELAGRHQQIQDSIQYAQRIQTCILADPQGVIRQFNDAFIYLRPREVVSGDFYWFSRFGEQKIIICGDCTGHGVPGAFMTLLGNDLLHTVVNEHRVLRPAALLEELDMRLRKLLAVSACEDVPDGMELSVCSLDTQTRQVVYAGARLPLYHVHEGKVTLIRGTRRAIGGRRRARALPFAETFIQADPGDVLYMSTDGYQDQFGGEKGRKYMRGRFQALLTSIAAYPMNEQAQRLNQHFEQWKGPYVQLDDVLVIGMRL